MKTDDLIEALAAGIEPVGPARLSPWMIGGAFAMAVTAVVILLGVLPGLSVVVQGPAFWLKAAYTGALAVAALWLVTRLGRPGAALGFAGWPIAAIVGVAGIVGATELMLLPAEARMDDWLGFTWKVCALNILMVSAFTAPLIFLAARRLAPTRPMQAGAATGLLTGAVAATAYGLHCPEATAAFVATWYTLGMAAAAAIGAVIGRFALRW
jgi:hypothetical protein